MDVKALIFRAAFDLYVYMYNVTWSRDDWDYDMDYIAVSADEKDRTDEKLALRHLYQLLSEGKMSVKDFSRIVSYAANAEETFGENTFRSLCEMIFDATGTERDADGIDYLVSTLGNQK